MVPAASKQKEKLNMLPEKTLCCSYRYQIRMDKKAFIYPDQLNAWYTILDKCQLPQKTFTQFVPAIIVLR